MKRFATESDFNPMEVARFNRILEGNIYEIPRTEISGSGYVLHTLEASLWCFLTSNSYEEATLKAVNLGSDTDTTGAVTGGLAGLYYGVSQIPTEWTEILARKADIEELIHRFEGVLHQFEQV